MEKYLDQSAFALAFAVGSFVNVVVMQSPVSAAAFAASLLFMAFTEHDKRKTNMKSVYRDIREEVEIKVEALKRLITKESREALAHIEELQHNQVIVQRQAEETRKLLSIKNVEGAFIPRAKRGSPNV